MSQCESCVTVLEWLCVLRLEQYSEAFQSAGLETLQQCRNLTADQLEQMGITLPGHRRRILASLNKTHANSDPHSEPVESDRDQGSVEAGHAKVLLTQRPVPVPGEGKPVLKERAKRDEATSKPPPPQREKPVPKERQGTRMREESRAGGEKQPVPGPRPEKAQGGEEGERNGRMNRERGRPVAKARTKFLPPASADCHPNPLVSPTFDTSLPPVPPRSTPNCPPQPFTSPSSPSSPAWTPASPTLSPAVQSRSVSQSSTPTSTPSHTATHASLHPLHTPTFQTRPQTLPVLPPARQKGSDEGRNPSPTLPLVSPIDRNAPPLPPKVGVLFKDAPPLPQRMPVQFPTAQR